MSNRSAIAFVISTMISSVLFGVGAVIVLATPSLAKQATYLLPMVIVVSFLITPMIAWYLAPRLRARAIRQEVSRQRGARS